MTIQEIFTLAAQHRQAGRLDDAAALFRQATTLRSNDPVPYNNLGIVLYEAGRYEEAIAAYSTAVELKPDVAETHNNLGNALSRTGKRDEAVAAFNRAIQLRPDQFLAYINLGNVLHDKGHFDEAITTFHRAISLNPDQPETHYNLGIVLASAHRLDEAIDAFRKAVDLRPDYPDAWGNLGAALEMTNECDHAEAALNRAITLRPADYVALNNLGSLRKNQGFISQALECYQRAMSLRPDRPGAHSNYVYSLHFDPDCGPARLLEAHQQWAQRHAQPLAPFIQAHNNDRSHNRRLKIGYVSPDFRAHVVGWNLLPLLEMHDPAQFEIFCYSDARRIDGVTDRIRAAAHHWRPIMNLTDQQTAELIRQDQIDILVDLTLHMRGNRLLVFARKPAPIQVTYLGYCGGTGLEAMDYRFSDACLDPPGTDEFYVEKTVRLPLSYWCYRPGGPTPDVAPLADKIVFTCQNNFAKVSTSALDAWKQILNAIPNSQLVIHCHPGHHRQRVVDRLGGAVRFVAMQSWPDYLETFASAAISLDPFPYCGGITTCDSLWMGVPVVSLAGTTPVARAGRTLLTQVGMPDLVTDTPDEYVKIAITLANDRPRLDEIRRTMRDRMKSSPLMDAPRLAHDIESAYRQMWQTWITR